MKTEYIILIIAVLATLLIPQLSPEESSIKSEFNKFKVDFSKEYTPEEELYRFQIFSENFLKVQIHNADATQTYQMGINQFSDMTQQEFIGKPSPNDR